MTLALDPDPNMAIGSTLSIVSIKQCWYTLARIELPGDGYFQNKYLAPAFLYDFNLTPFIA